MAHTHHLAVDIGNTRIKAAVFLGNVLLKKIQFEFAELAILQQLISKYNPTHSIISNVSKNDDGIANLLKQHTQVFILSHHLQLPFKNEYSTPETLGMDRIAGISGALHFFGGKGCLVIDIGTCITYDFVTAQAHYLGGAISPGLTMRLKAMHHFTHKLPNEDFTMPFSVVGNTTQSCMLSGSFYGLVGEIDYQIKYYEKQYGAIQVLLCGGDAELFEKHTKKSIFAEPDLVLFGLQKILEYNAYQSH